MVVLLFRDTFSEWLTLEPLYIALLLLNVCTTSALQIFQAEQRSKVEYKLSSALTLGTSFGSMVMTLLFVTLFPDKLLAVILGAISAAFVAFKVGPFLPGFVTGQPSGFPPVQSGA